MYERIATKFGTHNYAASHATLGCQLPELQVHGRIEAKKASYFLSTASHIVTHLDRIWHGLIPDHRITVA